MIILLTIHTCFLDSRAHPDRYTISAARASFIDNDLGSLSIGKLADFVILSTDSWKDFTETASASIEATYVSGSCNHLQCRHIGITKCIQNGLPSRS
ncbi:putative amidohydrolase YtcJ-like protein [Trifolium medium]|uniref:Putative amidohydrolase YtcJ-like protein n=1 Tax=Trifolium medium TaxID=97028 RepID=A0A392P5Z6_9FABA|nr:putative amidohydrolase YtcJ-like protein [Trifolium medium]